MADTATKDAAQAQKALGTAAYKAKDFETAIKHYTDASVTDPTDMVYHMNLGAVYLEMGNTEMVVESCTKAAEVGMDNRADYKMIAKAYGRIAKAYSKVEKPEPDEERISPDSAFVVGRRGKREAFLSGRVARNIGNISGHPMALSADRKSRRCVVCCEMCNRGDQTHVHRHGARTRFGCTKCYVGFARYKSRLCGKRSRISETENNEIINLCNKPNVEGDTRSCFQIHHESQGELPVLPCQRRASARKGKRRSEGAEGDDSD